MTSLTKQREYGKEDKDEFLEEYFEVAWLWLQSWGWAPPLKWPKIVRKGWGWGWPQVIREPPFPSLDIFTQSPQLIHMIDTRCNTSIVELIERNVKI
jgi:hypothetical protein